MIVAQIIGLVIGISAGVYILRRRKRSRSD